MRYWVLLEGRVQGGYAPDELARMPGFSSATLVCASPGPEGGSPWQAAGAFPELSRFFEGGANGAPLNGNGAAAANANLRRQVEELKRALGVGDAQSKQPEEPSERSRSLDSLIALIPEYEAAERRLNASLETALKALRESESERERLKRELEGLGGRLRETTRTAEQLALEKDKLLKLVGTLTLQASDNEQVLAKAREALRLFDKGASAAIRPVPIERQAAAASLPPDVVRGADAPTRAPEPAVAAAPQRTASAGRIDGKELLGLAVLAGVNVASLYYNQPLLAAIRRAFGATTSQVGWVPTLTQLGYATGLLLFVPMGDLFNRVRLLKIFNVASAALLVAIGLSPNLTLMRCFCFLLGLSTVTPQIILPYVVERTPAEQRGRASGTVLTGIMMGILLARTFAAFLGAYGGWRAVFFASAGLLVAASAATLLRLEPDRRAASGSYGALLLSLFSLLRQDALLRESCVVAACLFAASSTLWSTLIFLFHSAPFHWDLRAIGLFGLLGAGGALGANFAGRGVDKFNPRHVVASGLAIAVLAFVILGFSRQSVAGLVAGVFLVSLGIQGAHAANQTRVLLINPAARSRLNTLYMLSYYLGGALGSSLGVFAWSNLEWTGVWACALFVLGEAALELAVHF